MEKATSSFRRDRTIARTAKPVPSPVSYNFTQALTLWRRVEARLSRSSIWSKAPPEVCGAEFLSIVRLLILPARTELALISLESGSVRLLACTDRKRGHINKTIWPWVLVRPDKETPPKSGPNAWRKYVERLVWHKPIPFEGANGAYELRIASEPKDKVSMRIIREFLTRSQVGELLSREHTSDQWQHMVTSSLNVQRFSNRQFSEVGERLESDLSIHLSAQLRDIWFLMHDQERRRLRFLTSKEKLSEIFETFRTKGQPPTLKELGELTEVSMKELKTLSKCESGLHTHLRWLPRTRLERDHLECMAEKFDGWPADEGIVSSVIGSGCADAVSNFSTTDWRVKEYQYDDKPVGRVQGETPEFHRVRVAERIFINILPHVVEFPLFWLPGDLAHESLDAPDTIQSDRCWAVLMVLLSDEGEKLAARCIEIRSVVEQWYLLFEYQLHAMHRSQLETGHILHEAFSALSALEPAEPSGRTAWDLQANRLRALIAAYESRTVGRQSTRQFTSEQLKALIYDVLVAVFGEAKIAQGVTWSVHKLVQASVRTQPLDSGLARAALVGLLSSSAQELTELAKNSETWIAPDAIAVSFDRSEGEPFFTISIRHGATKPSLSFLAQNLPNIGRQGIPDEGAKKLHRGLFLTSSILRVAGIEFRRPKMDRKEGEVTWILGVPIAGGAH